MGIARRKNGKFTAQVKDPVTGKKVSLGTFTRYQDARAAILAASDAKTHGEPLNHLTKGNMAFDRFVDEVFLKSPRLQISPKTREQYTTECRRLKEYFGSKPLNGITQRDVLQFIEDFRFVQNPETDETVPRSKNYQRKIAQRLRQVFNVAVEEGYIPASAHPYTKELRGCGLPPRPKELNRVMLSYEAAKQILSIMDVLSKDTASSREERFEAEYWCHLLTCALHAGLRMSELCGLTTSDLVWQHNLPCVYVHRQWGWNAQAQSETLRFVEPKSKNSVRHVPVTSAVFDILMAWATRMSREKSPDGLLFPRPMPKRNRHGNELWGRWGSPSGFCKRYKKMLLRVWDYYAADIAAKPWVSRPFSQEDIVVSIHQWRHCYCVSCLQAGIDVNTVSKWMGHHSASFTYEVYSRFVQTAEAANLDKLDAWYAKRTLSPLGI